MANILDSTDLGFIDLSVQMSNTKQISNFLTSEIFDLSDALSTEIDDLSAALSGEIDTLSGKLSDEIDILNKNVVHLNGNETINGQKTFNEIILYKDSLTNFSNDSQIVNKKYVDNKVESTVTGAVKYQKSIELKKHNDTQISGSFGASPEHPIEKGYMYSISNAIDITVNGVIYSKNDYIIANVVNDKIVSDIVDISAFTWIDAQDTNDAKIDGANEFTENNTFKKDVTVEGKINANTLSATTISSSLSGTNISAVNLSSTNIKSPEISATNLSANNLSSTSLKSNDLSVNTITINEIKTQITSLLTSNDTTMGNVVETLNKVLKVLANY